MLSLHGSRLNWFNCFLVLTTTRNVWRGGSQFSFSPPVYELMSSTYSLVAPGFTVSFTVRFKDCTLLHRALHTLWCYLLCLEVTVLSVLTATGFCLQSCQKQCFLSLFRFKMQHFSTTTFLLFFKQKRKFKHNWKHTCLLK